MKVTLGQICSSDDKTANIGQILEHVKLAHSEGSDLVIFPEFAMYDLPQPDFRFVENAEPIDGPFAQSVSAMAADFQIFIVVGILESIEAENRVFNTLLAFDKSGQLVATYRKIHLYNAFGARESDLVAPSPDFEPSIFQVEDFNVGLHTCYDLRFPETSRSLMDAGADLLVLPASWVPGPLKEYHWKTLAKARAIENTVFFASVGQAPPVASGSSLLIDPMGIVIGELGETVSSATFEIGLDRISQVRAKNPCLSDRQFSVQRTES